MPVGTEVPPVATAVPAEREALQMHLERHQRLSAGLAVPEDPAGHKASVEMGVQAVPRMP